MSSLRGALRARCRRFGEYDADSGPYTAGDDARRIDWAASARCGELVARQRRSPAPLRLAAIVDESSRLQIGRRRLLVEAAREMRDAWFAAGSGDRLHIVFRTASARNLESALRSVLGHGLPVSALLLLTAALPLPQGTLLRTCASHFDSTVMIAHDPWHEDLPIQGLAMVQDASGIGARQLFFNARRRRLFAHAVAQRQRLAVEHYESCGWRASVFGEEGSVSSLYAAFGLSYA